jgi:hypothetical protein
MKAASVVFLSALLVPLTVFAASDSQRPFNEARDQYYSMLVNGEFQRLDTEAQTAREKSLVLDDGQPRLAALYAGISGCLTSGCQNTLAKEDWEKRLARLKEWVKTNPDSITASVALATYYLEYGWVVRGQGYRDSVHEEAWPVFNENANKSKTELMALGARVKNDPGWYTSLLRVARSQGWPLREFDDVYNEAVKRFPGYLPLYFEKAQYLAPRWHGSKEEFKKYVEDVTKETDPILGKTLYARLNWLIYTNDMFSTGQANWSEMKSGFERIVKDYPHPWNINNYAKFACLARDAKTFAALNEKIDGHPILAAFGGDQEWFDWCRKSMVPLSH